MLFFFIFLIVINISGIMYSLQPPKIPIVIAINIGALLFNVILLLNHINVLHF